MKRLLTFILIGFCFLISTAQTVGTIDNTQESWQGYTLLNAMADTNTYLIDNCGQVVNQWTSTYQPGNHCELDEDGNLYRSGELGGLFISAGGAGGIIEKYDWDNNLLWSYILSDSTYRMHHDFTLMPNGNILAIVWEYKDSLTCIQAGRDPGLLTQGAIWVDNIIEIEPVGIDSGTIVWEWSAWDHLVQDYDAGKDNYGDIGTSPRRLNLNSGPNKKDWMHVNAVDYHEGKDLIIISCPKMNEIYIIDHSTTTGEAATSSGGNYGFGGDFLFRWGNPQMYDQGSPSDQRLFFQHDAQWINTGLKDEGKILLFNNQMNDGVNDFSSVFTIDPDTNALGEYMLHSGTYFGPTTESWSYDLPLELWSNVLSGAQRLPNGNTLIISGRNGTFIEIDSLDSIVWRYKSPVGTNGIITQGSTTEQSQFLFYPNRYSEDFIGFTGKDLTPGNKIELNPLNDCVVYDNDLSLDEVDLDFSLYPNPTDGSFVVSGLNEKYELVIWDSSGRAVYNSIEYGMVNIQIDLEVGTYLLGVSTEMGISVKRLIIL